MGELKKLEDEGKIKYIGLSEPSLDTITALEMEYSLWTHDIENEIIPLCRLAVISTYSPLGRGLFGGKAILESLPSESLLLSSQVKSLSIYLSMTEASKLEHLSMDTYGKIDVEFQSEVLDILARHETKFERINTTLQMILIDLQDLRIQLVQQPMEHDLNSFHKGDSS
ncbi:hypothetical protein FEM48_Zijuj07G0118800 [Ziziphus jujuba var. spinosa]|uniref:NADP-dependent oxidoreductase domain-containing protein n=1 Tax=Ziziphus jujuba var. spinosa TaxID=714518 RepID=A0A978V4G9_ZIZJJ|nr:hypothetical protein FEM48_Zijuj07G0118800 [Ziziphus jujuba var. spinosa]